MTIDLDDQIQHCRYALHLATMERRAAARDHQKKCRMMYSHLDHMKRRIKILFKKGCTSRCIEAMKAVYYEATTAASSSKLSSSTTGSSTTTSTIESSSSTTECSNNGQEHPNNHVLFLQTKLLIHLYTDHVQKKFLKRIKLANEKLITECMCSISVMEDEKSALEIHFINREGHLKYQREMLELKLKRQLQATVLLISALEARIYLEQFIVRSNCHNNNHRQQDDDDKLHNYYFSSRDNNNNGEKKESLSRYIPLLATLEKNEEKTSRAARSRRPGAQQQSNDPSCQRALDDQMRTLLIQESNDTSVSNKQNKSSKIVWRNKKLSFFSLLESFGKKMFEGTMAA